VHVTYDTSGKTPRLARRRRVAKVKSLLSLLSECGHRSGGLNRRAESPEIGRQSENHCGRQQGYFVAFRVGTAGFFCLYERESPEEKAILTFDVDDIQEMVTAIGADGLSTGTLGVGRWRTRRDISFRRSRVPVKVSATDLI
jgi:hypothetical protein